MIITIGGGSRPQTDEIWNYIYEQVNNKLLYVPYARDVEDYEDCLRYIKREVGEGFTGNITLLENKSWYYPDEFDEYDVMYIGGGSVPVLLNFIYTTHFDGVLHHWNDANKIIIGSSAGSIILGRDARMYRDFPSDISAFEGLDLCRGVSFVCHYQETGYYKEWSAEAIQQKILEYINNNYARVMAIPEESAIVWNKNGIIVKTINAVTEYKKEKIG